MIEKTKNYDIFKILDDNRKINKNHVADLCESLKKCNMLELQPILVNSNMEVIDGQHRLMAARTLDLEIYYKIEKDMDSSNMILLNVAKAWNDHDYFNYYIKNGKEEYIKLQKFMQTHDISLYICFVLIIGRQNKDYDKFRKGEFVFETDIDSEKLNLCWEIINYIVKINGRSQYLRSGKFWKALVQLITHAHFDIVKWRKNLPKMIDTITPRTNKEEYFKMLLKIHNYHNRNPITGEISCLDMQ